MPASGTQAWKLRDSGMETNMETNTWDAFCRAFLARFAVKETTLYAQLAACRQKANESVREYSDRFRHLLARLRIKPDTIQMYNYLRGLHSSIYSQVYLMRPSSLETAIEDAIYASEVEESARNPNNFSQQIPLPISRTDYRPADQRPRPSNFNLSRRDEKFRSQEERFNNRSTRPLPPPSASRVSQDLEKDIESIQNKLANLTLALRQQGEVATYMHDRCESEGDDGWEDAECYYSHGCGYDSDDWDDCDDGDPELYARERALYSTI